MPSHLTSSPLLRASLCTLDLRPTTLEPSGIGLYDSVRRHPTAREVGSIDSDEWQNCGNFRCAHSDSERADTHSMRQKRKVANNVTRGPGRVGEGRHFTADCDVQMCSKDSIVGFCK